MSERYVWDKYNTSEKAALSDPSLARSLTSSHKSITLCNEYELQTYGVIAKGETTTITEANVAGGGSYAYAPTSSWKYAIISVNTAVGQSGGSQYQAITERTDTAFYWVVEGIFAGIGQSASNVIGVTLYQCSRGAISSSGAEIKNFSFRSVYQKTIQGDVLQGRASSASRSAYPDDGASGSIWYVYKGSDSIDPVGISYDSNRAERNKPVKVVVEPREDNFEWNTIKGPLHEGRYYDTGTCVAYGGGKFVAVPSDYYEDETPGSAAYGTDGVNWKNTTIPVLFGNGYYQIAYGNGKFLAAGRTSSYCTDGATWIETGSYPIDPNNGRVASLSGVAFGSGKFVGFESDYPSGNLGAYTTDCETWTLIVFPKLANWRYIAYGSNKFVLLASSGETVYSTDGATWSVGATIPSTYPNALKYCNNKFYALPGNKTKNAYCSEDGVNWTVANIPNDCVWISMAYGGGKYILISEYDSFSPTKYAMSTDGENWVVSTIDINGTDDNGLVYGDDKFVCFEAFGDKVAHTTAGYGGTVSYQYQYSLNGGTTWINAGGTTTDTAKEIMVPADAEQFMARVRARDDMGFVSNDYIVGENLKVVSIKMWVGIDGKACRVKKLWTGVDGRSRPAAHGWIGDENGRARRFF